MISSREIPENSIDKFKSLFSMLACISTYAKMILHYDVIRTWLLTNQNPICCSACETIFVLVKKWFRILSLNGVISNLTSEMKLT